MGNHDTPKKDIFIKDAEKLLKNNKILNPFTLMRYLKITKEKACEILQSFAKRRKYKIYKDEKGNVLCVWIPYDDWSFSKKTSTYIPEQDHF